MERILEHPPSRIIEIISGVNDNDEWVVVDKFTENCYSINDVEFIARLKTTYENINVVTKCDTIYGGRNNHARICLDSDLELGFIKR